MKKKLLILVSAMAMVAFAGCQKSDEKSENSSTSNSLSENVAIAATSVSTSQMAFSCSEDIQATVLSDVDSSYRKVKSYFHRYGKGAFKLSLSNIPTCATVTVSSDTFPKTITIDYGTSGCASQHGNVKTGKIIIEVTDTIINAGAVKSIVYSDFYVNGNNVEGSGTIQNLGKNSKGNWVLATNTDFTFTDSSNNLAKEVYNDTIEWVSGFETADKTDDVYYKTGDGSITLNDTIAYSRTITTPLLMDNTCGYIISGVETLYKNGSAVIIDYGDGTCDAVATVTIDGTTEEISLENHHFKKGGHFEKQVGHGKGNKKGLFGF